VTAETRRAHLLGEVGVDAEERLEVCDVGHGAAKLLEGVVGERQITQP
jgi:hypothetical protein